VAVNVSHVNRYRMFVYVCVRACVCVCERERVCVCMCVCARVYTDVAVNVSPVKLYHI